MSATTWKTATTAPASCTSEQKKSRAVCQRGHPCNEHSHKAKCDSGSESEDSVIGVITRSQARSSIVGFTKVELRLYRKTNSDRPGAYGPVVPYGPMFLPLDCTTAFECFALVREKIQKDCSFIVFQLPEDMGGVAGGVRIIRGSSDAERTFQRVLEMFRKAKKFPGEPQYRSVEVEVGL